MNKGERAAAGNQAYAVYGFGYADPGGRRRRWEPLGTVAGSLRRAHPPTAEVRGMAARKRVGSSRSRVSPGRLRECTSMEGDPGPPAEEKLEPTSDPSRPQPQAAEVDSARVLANQARDVLHARGLDDDEIGRLADEYVALDIGEAFDAFIEWPRTVGLGIDRDDDLGRVGLLGLYEVPVETITDRIARAVGKGRKRAGGVGGSVLRVERRAGDEQARHVPDLSVGVQD